MEALGLRGARRACELAGRRDRARRGLRLGADHRGADRAPAAGRVIAVDESPSMVDGRARAPRPGAPSVRVGRPARARRSSEPVDAILSTATFHWIADHERLFARLHAALRPGGRLVAQCGGEGNIDVPARARRPSVLRARALRRALRRLAAAVELRRPRGDARAPARRRLRERRVLARAGAPQQPERAARVPLHDRARPARQQLPRSCASRSWTTCWRSSASRSSSTTCA